LDYDDLLSFGVFGLLDAIDRFEISKGFSFQTFAVPRIRGAILDELRRNEGKISRKTSLSLARKAFCLTHTYDGNICDYLEGMV